MLTDEADVEIYLHVLAEQLEDWENSTSFSSGMFCEHAGGRM